MRFAPKAGVLSMNGKKGDAFIYQPTTESRTPSKRECGFFHLISIHSNRWAVFKTITARIIGALHVFTQTIARLFSF